MSDELYLNRLRNLLGFLRDVTPTDCSRGRNDHGFVRHIQLAQDTLLQSWKWLVPCETVQSVLVSQESCLR